MNMSFANFAFLLLAKTCFEHSKLRLNIEEGDDKR